MKRILLAVLCWGLLASSALGQIPGPPGLVVGNGTTTGTVIQGGTATDCLVVGTGNKLTQTAGCGGAGVVSSFSAGSTGFTPSSATTGVVTLAGTLIGANGGTGVVNTGKTITLGGSLVTSGAFASTFTMTNTTTVTFPTTGTLATLAGSEALTNKTYNGNTWTAGTGVLTIAAAKTLAASNTITFTATDGSTLAIGAGGTLASAAYVATGTSGATIPLLNGANTWSGAQAHSANDSWGSSTRLKTTTVSGGNFSNDTIQYDDNSATAVRIYNNFGITNTNQGLVDRWVYGTGGSTGATAGQVAFLATDTWAAAGNRSSQVVISTTTAGSLGTAIQATTTRLTLPGDILTILTTDATLTSRSVCQNTADSTLHFGSGAAGVCLGTSSARYKTGIAPLHAGLAEIAELKPVSYRYRADYGTSDRDLYGFTAEQVYGVMPELVGLDKEGRPNSVDWAGMVPVLANAVRELKASNDNLAEQVRNLRSGSR